MGDIGRERREVEFEPLAEEPVTEPAPEPASKPAPAAGSSAPRAGSSRSAPSLRTQ